MVSEDSFQLNLRVPFSNTRFPQQEFCSKLDLQRLQYTENYLVRDILFFDTKIQTSQYDVNFVKCVGRRLIKKRFNIIITSSCLHCSIPLVVVVIV